ncbi:MAG: zinc-binding dehydrogenase [Lewinella sp.]|nr:zinc-binding dehydrogenase [Lewinella sp.]
MDTCKIAVFNAPNDPIKIEEVPLPELGPGEILVKNEYTTLCRSDINIFSGKRKEKTPTILGHEVAGRIAALSQGSPKMDLRGRFLRVGDRITWATYVSEPESELADSGIPQRGTGLFKYGYEKITPKNTLHGGLGEYMLLRANTPVVKVEESVPAPLVAIINCVVATVAAAMRVAGRIHGKNVVISGAGMLGAIACAMAKTEGAAQVVAIDADEDRRKKALDFGADTTLPSSADGAALLKALEAVYPQGLHIHKVLEFSGVAEAMESTLSLLGEGGSAVWVGATYPQRNLQLSAELLVRNLYSIKGIHHYSREDFLRAIQFMEHHHRDFPFLDMVHDQFTLPEVNEAFAYALEHNPFRVGVRISS